MRPQLPGFPFQPVRRLAGRSPALRHGRIDDPSTPSILCVDKLNAQFHGKRNVTPSLIWGSGRSGGLKRSRSISTPTNDLIVALSFGTPQPPSFFAPFPAHQARVWALTPGCNSSALTSCAPEGGTCTDSLIGVSEYADRTLA